MTMSAARSEWSTGKWPLVAGFLGLMIAPSVLPVYTQTLFVAALEQEFGWSRIEVSLGVTFLIAALAISSPIAGFLADRLPVRWLVAGSALMMALNFVLLAQASSLLSYYLPMTLMALLGGGCATPSFARIIASAFRKYRGTALGIAMSGTGAVTIAAPVFLGPFILSHGWRSGYLVLAALEFGAALAFLWLLRDTVEAGEEAGVSDALPHAGVTLREAMATGHFWLLAGLFLVLQLIVTGLLTQMSPILVDRGMAPVAAAQAASGIGLAVLLARLVTGFLIDRIFAPYVACAILLISAAGLATLVVGGADFGFYGALAAGLVIGSEIDMIGYLTARYFGLRHYGRIYGLLYAFLLAGTAISPLLYAWAYQVEGGYDRVLIVSAAALAVTALLCLCLPRFPAEQAADGNIPDTGSREEP